MSLLLQPTVPQLGVFFSSLALAAISSLGSYSISLTYPSSQLLVLIQPCQYLALDYHCQPDRRIFKLSF